MSEQHRLLVRYDKGYLYKSMTGRHIEAYFDWERAAGHKIAATSGCFELLHPGHLRVLQLCRDLAPSVVVCLNSDRSVRLQGKTHSLITVEIDRATVLASVRFVDNVVLFDEKSPVQLLELIKPDFFVNGGDKELDDIPLEERAAVQKHGGQVVFSTHEGGQSTTEIYNRIVIGHIIKDRVDGGVL